MDDLMNKIQNVLSDEESMRQIKELAEMLSLGGLNEPQNQEAQPVFSHNPPQLQQPPPSNTSNDLGLDISKLMKLQGIFSSVSKKDKNIDLLLALKPLLKDESQKKIDNVIKIFKIMALWPSLKESGLLGGDLLGFL